MDEFVIDADDEAIGTSPQKGALVAGAIAALWLTRQRHQGAPELVPTADAS